MKIFNNIKKNKLVRLNVIILSAILCFSLIVSFFMFSKITRDDKKLSTTVIFRGIYTAIDNEIELPAKIVKTMCYDSFLQDLLDEEGLMPQDEFNYKIGEYLRTIRDGNGWESAYIVSSRTLNYYTADGLSKTVDPENDDYDVWYKNFLATGLEYGADMSYDEHNEQAWTIFIDRRMDVDGKLKAVFGCAVYLSDISNMLAEFSQQYNVDVYFTDAYGNITLDKDGVSVGEAYYSRNYSPDMIREYSEYTDGAFYVKQYIPLLGMYLVVKNTQHLLSLRFLIMLMLYLLCYFIFLIIIVVYNLNTFNNEKIALGNKVRTDYLTKISNLNGLQDSINLFIEEEGSHHIGGTMLMLDIDYFKNVNDTLGHGKGDEVLIKVATILSKSFRGGDIVGRLGGDEFMVFSPSLKDYDSIANKCKELNNSFRFTVSNDEGKSVNISASIGVSAYPQDADNYHDLYKKTDEALYYSKNHGKDRYCIYCDIANLEKSKLLHS
ncbi:MAG: sensor domain-containing diguanylate cyclase [Butyrivibrio sp.]|nr:sensor domain-containing diguanylate cyclase [Butyrivibrio sp.]